jgi:hypothetical protein
LQDSTIDALASLHAAPDRHGNAVRDMDFYLGYAAVQWARRPP